MMINTKWLKAAAIRALKTVAQSAIAALGCSLTIYEVDWKYVIGVSALAGVLSVLTSMAGLPECDEEE